MNLRQDDDTISVVFVVIIFVLFIVGAAKLYQDRPIPVDPLQGCEFVSKERTGKTEMRMSGKLSYKWYETVYVRSCPEGRRLGVQWER